MSVFHLLHKRAFPCTEQQRQQYGFLNDKMGIELSGVRGVTGNGRRLDERSIA